MSSIDWAENVGLLMPPHHTLLSTLTLRYPTTTLEFLSNIYDSLIYETTYIDTLLTVTGLGIYRNNQEA